MIKLTLHEFQHYDENDLSVFLALQTENYFQILVNRSFSVLTGTYIDVSLEFSNAALIGEKLKKIGKKFAYNVPDVYGTKPFKFEFTIKDKEKLARVLFFSIKGMYERERKVRFSLFHRQSALLYNAVGNDELLPACWGLISVANKYFVLSQHK